MHHTRGAWRKIQFLNETALAVAMRMGVRMKATPRIKNRQGSKRDQIEPKKASIFL
jgi:hypothetical protein